MTGASRDLSIAGFLGLALALIGGCGSEVPSKAPPAKMAADTSVKAVISTESSDDCCSPSLLPEPASTPASVPPAPAGQAGAMPSQATFGVSVARNMVNLVDKNVPTDWSVEEGKFKNVKWVATIGSKSYGSPTVHGGRVFVGTNNDKPRDPAVKGRKAVLMCFNHADGKFLWQNAHDEADEAVIRDGVGSGMASSPTCEGEFIYYCTPACEVICAKAVDGKIIWRYDLMKELKVFPCYLCNCSPLVVGDQVYVTTGNGTNESGKLPSPSAPSFVALTKKDGKLVWQNNLPGANVVDGQWSNPAYAEVNGKGQVICAAGDGCVYGLSPKDGTMIWKFQASFKTAKEDRAGVQPYFLASPAVVGDKAYIGLGAAPDLGAAPKFSHFFCLDITRSGDVSCKNAQFDPADPANKNSALVWQYGGLNTTTSAKERKVRFGPTISTAAVHDGLAYITELTGYVYCLDAKTGQHYWTHDAKAAIWGSPYWVDGKIFVCTEGDSECLIFTHGKTYAKPRVIDMQESMDSTVVVDRGTLFVTTKTKIYAIEAAK